jgi:hypothetical protein
MEPRPFPGDICTCADRLAVILLCGPVSWLVQETGVHMSMRRDTAV